MTQINFKELLQRLVQASSVQHVREVTRRQITICIRSHKHKVKQDTSAGIRP